jgi:ribose-phosphate pyrophosphokinase
MKIFSGTSSQRLTEKICKILNKELKSFSSFGMIDEEITPGKLKIDKFSDGEILPLFGESIRDQDVFFVQTTNNSDNIMETLLVIDAAKRAGCKSFTLVAPFQGYSRQDKTDHLRSSIGSKMLADILTSAGMNRIITIDLHASAIQGFYNVPVIHLNGNKIFIDYIKENHIEDLTIVAPDQGAVKRASDFCKAFPESTFAMINKKRIKPNEIHSMELVGDVSGRNVVIVDDMADTLGTMCKAAELLIDKGAKSVRCIATHGILSGKAIDNLYNSKITELLVSDSIPFISEKDSSRNEGRGLKQGPPSETKLKVISCDRIIGKSIWGLVNRQSIHELNTI